jgi:LuxR family transcriptional regulator, activator of conjugal transfer of Ti plasmids
VSREENLFQEFIDAIQTADDDLAFERIATRVTQHLGFKRFAYLRLIGPTPTLISSYPKSWTRRYFDLGYQKIDPVVRRTSRENALFT